MIKRQSLPNRFMGLAGTFALAAFSLGAQAIDVPLSKDAEVRQAVPGAKLGGRKALAVREAQLQQSLFDFDLSSLSGPIESATLTLRVEGVFRAGDFEVRRLLSDWEESSVSFNNAPAIGSQVDATGSVQESDDGREVDFDVTAMVQALIDDPANNFGFALVPDGPVYLKFASGETANAPRLAIESEGPPPVDPIVIENVLVTEDELSINGQNFDNGVTPSVSIAGVGLLDVTMAEANNIMATFVGGDLPDGDFLLIVTTGPDAGQTAMFDLTIGAVGNQGPPGPQGPQGEQGPEGPQGPQGIAGVDGVDGAVGPTGPQGPQGIAGVDGVDGVDGAVGPTGPQGDAGADGIAGPPGQPGAPGATGLTGAPGPMGPPGINGLDGAIGPAGPQGAPGVAGTNGTDGAIGISGRERRVSCSSFVTIPADGQYGWAVACSAGKKALGGGGYFAFGGASPLAMTRSYSTYNSNLDLDVWTTEFWNPRTTQIATFVCAQVICANVEE